MTFYWPNFVLSNSKVQLFILSPQNNINFNFQPSPMLVFLVFTRTILLRVIHLSKISQYTTFHGPMLTGAHSVFASVVQNVRHFETAEVTGVKTRRRGHLEQHDFHTECHTNLLIVSKVIRGSQTDRWNGDLINLVLLLRKVSKKWK